MPAKTPGAGERDHGHQRRVGAERRRHLRVVGDRHPGLAEERPLADDLEGDRERDRDADRDDLLQRQRGAADVHAGARSGAFGNERDVGPQTIAATFWRISATPSVLTSQAKLKRSKASTGRTATR